MTNDLALTRLAVLVLSATAFACAGDVPVDPGQPPAGPAAPVWTGIQPAAAANDNEPALQGRADARVTVHVYDGGCDGALLGTSAADANGAFVLRVKVADNRAYSFFASATDAQGRNSPCSEPLQYVEDSIAPGAPAWPAAALPPANENAPELTGTAEAQAKIRLYAAPGCSGAIVGEGLALADGTFQVKAQVGDDSTTDFSATATDAAGNVSTCSAPRRYVEDSTPPARPALTAVQPAPVANENRPTLVGSSEPRAVIAVFAAADCAGAPVTTVSASE
ncbi:MAG: Ig-like domain-containing protein, partial [Myxococcales bacterium]